MRKLLLLYAMLMVVVSLSAQQFGGNPPSLKWRQINTDTGNLTEIPKAQRRLLVKALNHSIEAHSNAKAGMRAAYASVDTPSNRLRKAFGVHYATVSRVVNKIESAENT